MKRKKKMSCCVDSLFPTQIHLRSCHPAILQPELNLDHLNADFFSFSFFFFWLCPHRHVGSYFLNQVLNLCPLHGVLTSGLAGKSLNADFKV